MGQYDKDRFQKELSIKYCLARGATPFLEVIVPSTSDLSDSVEVLTDIDVLGVETTPEGEIRRTIFDCKTTGKMSAINRAFWLAGLLQYSGCDSGYAILKARAVHNHRISALRMGVDLHDEPSFRALGEAALVGFEKIPFYQGDIENWNTVHSSFAKYDWSSPLFELSRSIIPVSHAPWNTFRRSIATLKDVRGQLDPAKPEHLSIFLDLVSSSFVLWAAMSRDLRRIFDPAMKKSEFENYFRYYIWGGKESYMLRRQMKELRKADGDIQFDLPAWPELLNLAALLLEAPHEVFRCAVIARELSIRFVVPANDVADKNLKLEIAANKRARQFVLAYTSYLVSAAGLPNDFRKAVEATVLAL